jgi:hypothetical protein
MDRYGEGRLSLIKYLNKISQTIDKNDDKLLLVICIGPIYSLIISFLVTLLVNLCNEIILL